MDKFKILILSLLLGAKSFHAQCDPTILNNNMLGCAPLELTFNAPSYISAAWVIGTTTLNGTTVTYTFVSPAVYIVSLTTVTNGTCLGAATITVNVVTGLAYGCTTTIQGLQSITNKLEFLISPNPTSDDII